MNLIIHQNIQMKIKIFLKQYSLKKIFSIAIIKQTKIFQILKNLEKIKMYRLNKLTKEV